LRFWTSENSDIERALEEEIQNSAAEITASLTKGLTTRLPMQMKGKPLTPAMATFLIGVDMVILCSDQASILVISGQRSSRPVGNLD
jgi:hypothetical protein